MSVTLDLILIVDKLFTLLRIRGEVLELTAVRLQWDMIRWKIQLETDRCREEVMQIVEDSKWHPPPDEVTVSSRIHSRRALSSTSAFDPPGPLQHVSASQSLGQSSLCLSPTLAKLDRQARDLSSDTRKVAGHLLDRMIDSATNIPGLGGIDGPQGFVNGADHNRGAVPEDFLDIQDALEVSVDALPGLLAFARQSVDLRSRWVAVSLMN